MRAPLFRHRRFAAIALAMVLYVQPLVQTVWALPAAPAAASAPVEPAQATPGVAVFGPTQYVRTSGPPNIYTAAFAKPSWLTGPFTMRVVNGSPEGTNRLSSTTILLNGAEVAVPTDFSQQVAGFERSVTLLPQNELEVQVTSIPEGYLTLWFLATNADHTSPQLSVTAPAAAAFLNADPITVTVQASDPVGAGEPGASGLNAATFQISIDGVNRTADFTIVNGLATAQLSGLTPGLHTVAAAVSDVAGNAATTASSFTVDRTAPQVVIAAPAAGHYTNAAAIQVSGSVTDSSTTTVIVDGVAADVAAGQFAATVPVGAGPSQTLDVVATDAAGNTTTSTVTINIDRAVPQLTLVSPAAGEYTNAASIEVRGTLVDASPTGVVVDGIAASVSGNQFVAAAVPVGAGPAQTINVVATDAAGNSSVAAVTINIDRASPHVVVAHPAPGQYTNAASIEVRGEVVDASATSVVVDGIAAVVNGTQFVAGTVPVGAGPSQAISVVATDAAANSTTTTVTINIDRVAPQLAIATPTAGQYTSADSIEVRGSVSDSSATSVVVDGIAATVNAGQFVANVPVGAAASQTITAVATDASGNTATAAVTINIDRAAPQVVITHPAAGQYTNATSIEVRGEVVDASVTSVVVDGIPAVVTGSQFVAAAVPVGAGASQTIAVVATDAAANGTTTTVTILIDRLAPQLAIVTPAAGQYTNAGSIEVRGTVADSSATGVVVDGIAAAVNGGQFVATVPLGAAAAQTITAVATDASGNTTTAAVTINIDRVAPQIVIISPTADQYTNATSLEVRGSIVDAAIAGVVVDGVAAAITGEQFVAAPVPLGDGPEQTITAVATDAAGNTTSTTVKVKIDRVPPQIAIIMPAAGQYTNATSIEVRGGVIDDAPTTVVVDGAPASVIAGEFVAADVAVGAGESQSISVIATDAAGNTATQSVTINIDRAPPSITLAAPPPGAVVKGPIVAVSGTVTDSSAAIVTVNGHAMTVAGNAFSGEVPSPDGQLLLHATAVDAAGNEASVEHTIQVDTAPPVVSITEPAPGTVTNQTSILVRGTVNDASATVVRAGAIDIVPVNGMFQATLPLPNEGTNLLIVTVTDAAGNTQDADVSVVADRTAPTLEITTPDAGDVIGAAPVIVQGTVFDTTGAVVFVNGTAVTVSGLTWEAAISPMNEGQTTFTVVARDAAGNESSTSRTIVVDLHDPIVLIGEPADGTATVAQSVQVAGTVQDVSVSQVSVNGVSIDLPPVQADNAPRAFSTIVSLEEGDTNITASVVDGVNRSGSATVVVTRDSTAPSISLTVAPKVTRARPAAASIIATDNIALDRVIVLVNGNEVQRFTAPPFALDISLPDGARPGDVLAVVAHAFDRLGNTSQATASLPVSSDGAVVGQVLDDATGRPALDEDGLPVGAVISIAGTAIEVDSRGRYSFATGEPRINLSATAPGMTTVDRTFDVASEAGTAALDARLTKLAAATPLPAGTNRIVPIVPAPASTVLLSLDVPDSLPEASTITATALSGQGLPGLLPLGWSPVAALNLRSSVPSDGFTLRAQNTGAAGVYLARYLNRQWYLASAALTPDGDGVIFAPLPAGEAIDVALVFADTGDGAPAIPAIGNPLPGVEPTPIPLTATSTGVLDPPVLSPGGGTSIGTLTVTSPTPLPSGTVVQAVVTETFTLSSGDTISEDARTQDFVLYRSGADLAARFPVVPSRSFAAAELVQGIVHLDILAGRESVRGLAGGSGAATLTTTGATLFVAQGALDQDVPITFQSAVLSSFLPVNADIAPLLEFAVDFSGRELLSNAELSIAATQIQGLAAGDALVLTRVDLIEGRTRLVPIAIGELAGDRYVARALHGLPGIRLGGRHVWYRVTGGVGFVRGVTDAGGTGLVTIVEAGNLPYASMAATSGQYTALARPGTTTIRARAPGTSLIGEAEATITANVESTANISLVGAVTTASIAPADGAINVSPAVQIDVTSAASINSQILANALIEFNRLSDPAGPVNFRLVLSGSGRTLAIVPLQRLAEGATYSISISGLADNVGGAITVPPSTFITQSNSSPQYDLEKLVFSFPNDQGEVTLTGPAGTLAPGSTVLVVNETTGEVSTLPVFNDGSVGGDLVAQISDRLIVTITDLQGRQTTFKRSTYVAADGTTAVGAGGGLIEGPGGVEVRVPEDAVMNGVAAILKIAAVSPEELPPGPLPDLFPGATVATSLKLESPEPPTFQKEVDLVFPKPADAPDNAVYFVYRRMQGPDGRIAYETIDYADVEGEGDNAKVVTASEPFSGYINSINGYRFQGIDGLGAIGSQLTNYAILMFHFDLALPGRALGGVITGRVVRPRFDPATGTTVYDGVAGALVSGVDAAGDPLYVTNEIGDPATVATSQADGTYSLFDRRYEGGAVTISATIDGVTRTATAYEVDPQNTKSPGLRFAKHVATANIAFPALPPVTPPSPVQVRVMTLDEDGVRQPANGIVVAGEPLVIGVLSSGNTVQRVEITAGSQASEYGVRIDPLDRKLPNTFDVIVEGNVSFAVPGTYTVTAHGLGAFGTPVHGAIVVRAAAAGGGNNESLPSDPPQVITERTLPKTNATGVPIGVLPQIVFTEPVQNVPSGVTLIEDGGGEVTITLSGVGPDGPIATLNDASIVTSITVQPVAGVKYGKRYTLTLSNAIKDTDDGSNNTPANKPLVPYTTSFTTFAPESIGSTVDTFTAGGIAVIGDRAYVASPQNAGRWFTQLRLFDVSDPTAPQEIGVDVPGGSHIFKAPPVWWLGLPVDVAAEEQSEWTGTNVVAVATTPLTYPYHASNVRLYDVSDDNTWRWIGAVSLGREPTDGMIRRIRLKGPTLYGLTAGMGKGFQVVDLDMVRGAFDAATAGGEQTMAYWNMQGQLNSTSGFAQEAILQTIHIPTGSGDNSQMWDMAIADVVLNGVTETAMVGTGRSPLAIATASQGLLYNGDILNEAGEAVTSWGFAVGTGTVNGDPIAAVAALGPAGPSSGTLVLAIVDLRNPIAPRARGWVALPGNAYGVHDVVIRNNVVFIGTTTGTLLVNVSDPDELLLMGGIPDVSGRLAFGAGGVLYGAYRGLAQITNPQGGLRNAALEHMVLVTGYKRDPITVSASDEVFQDTDFTYRLIPPDASVTSATLTIEVVDGGTVDQVASTPSAPDGGVARWPQGKVVNTTLRYGARVAVDGGTGGPLRPIHFDKVPLAITSRDRVMRIQFALAEQGLFTEKNYGVQVYVSGAGGGFPGAPTFSVTADQIRSAYPKGDEAWWEDLASGNDRSRSNWVTRRIDWKELPPGTDQLIRRQAFEIGAVLSSYPAVRVVVTSEETGRELAREEHVLSADTEWSAVLDAVTERIQNPNGTLVARSAIGFGSRGFLDRAVAFNDFAEQGSSDDGFFKRLSGLIYRVVHKVNEAQLPPVQMVKGAINGFMWAWDADIETASMFFQAVADPVNAAKLSAQVFKDVWEMFKQPLVTLQAIKNAMPDIDPLDLYFKAPYYAGWLIGFLIEQVIVKTAFLLGGVMTGGAVAAAAASATAIRVGTWVAGLSQKAIAAIRTMRRLGQALADLSGASGAAKAGLQAVMRSGDAVIRFQANYPQAAGLYRRLGEVLQTGAASAGTVVGRAIHWLGYVDGLSDAGAIRAVAFVERLGAAGADRLLGRWINSGRLAFGAVGVRFAFNAYPNMATAPEGVQDLLVVAAARNRSVSNPDANPLTVFVNKYFSDSADRVSSSLTPLRTTIDDATITDDAAAATVRAHARAEIPAVSDEAVRGSSSVANVRCPLLAAFALPAQLPPLQGCGTEILEDMADEYPELRERFETSMQNLYRHGNFAANQAFVRVALDAGDLDRDTVRAIYYVPSALNMTKEATAEYFLALDRMRDAAGNLRPGLLRADPASQGLGATANAKRVGNRGSGSIAEAFEIVVVARMIDAGWFAQDDIVAFGRKFDVSGILGSPNTIEADTFLANGTFIDAKYSVTGAAQITTTQILNLEQVLSNPNSPIRRVWFAVGDAASSDIENFISAANVRIRAAWKQAGIPDELEPIRIRPAPGPHYQ